MFTCKARLKKFIAKMIKQIKFSDITLNYSTGPAHQFPSKLHFCAAKFPCNLFNVMIGSPDNFP